ncbi:MAG: hypothetical protein UZ02_AOB001000259, partial [Nitrosomonas europaea]
PLMMRPVGLRTCTTSPSAAAESAFPSVLTENPVPIAVSRTFVRVR